mmetsp:Transcript_84395/g.217350  ORF Transcript_84395/g.217350 Transcript_84395/m.217350 type:complete len:100 (+) Transcript_84395:158-457(+)
MDWEAVVLAEVALRRPRQRRGQTHPEEEGDEPFEGEGGVTRAASGPVTMEEKNCDGSPLGPRDVLGLPVSPDSLAQRATRAARLSGVIFWLPSSMRFAS